MPLPEFVAGVLQRPHHLVPELPVEFDARGIAAADQRHDEPKPCPPGFGQQGFHQRPADAHPVVIGPKDDGVLAGEAVAGLVTHQGQRSKADDRARRSVFGHQNRLCVSLVSLEPVQSPFVGPLDLVEAGDAVGNFVVVEIVDRTDIVERGRADVDPRFHSDAEDSVRVLRPDV